MKNTWTIIGVITVAIFAGAIWVSGSSSEKSNEGVEVLAHIKGNQDSEIKLVEYSDLECPACAAFQPALNTILAEYGDKISFEYKHFPLSIHRNSIPAALAAEAAGLQGKFFEYHDLLFANQQTWASSNNASANFIKYAQDLELDVPTFKRQMNSSVLRDKIKDEFNEGRELNVTGTPSFFLNGKKMEITSFEGFVQQIANAVDPTLPTSTDSETDVAPEGSGIKFGI